MAHQQRKAARKPLVLIDVPFMNTGQAFRQLPLHSCIESNRLFVELKRDLERRGYEVMSIDQRDMADADHLVFFDAVLTDPYFREFKRRRKELKARASLVVIDARVVNQYEHTERALRLFDRVLTWDPARIDHKKFFPYHLPESFYPKNPFRIPYRKKRFLCMINGNKLSLYPTELYSERKRAALFFERTPEGIDVYGLGWDHRPSVRPILYHAAYRWRFLLTSLCTLRWKPFANLVRYALNRPRLRKETIKGRAEGSSVAVYAKYKFAICFENARDIPGYATEKLFNCLNARTIPIYWGDEEILRHVPAGCYIDMRKFTSYEELYAFLRRINEKEYANYLKRIETYLKTAEKGPYGIPAFLRSFYDGLLR